MEQETGAHLAFLTTFLKPRLANQNPGDIDWRLHLGERPELVVERFKVGYAVISRCTEREELAKYLTVKELRDILRIHGLPVSGKKDELITRVIDSDIEFWQCTNRGRKISEQYLVNPEAYIDANWTTGKLKRILKWLAEAFASEIAIGTILGTLIGNALEKMFTPDELLPQPAPSPSLPESTPGPPATTPTPETPTLLELLTRLLSKPTPIFIFISALVTLSLIFLLQITDNNPEAATPKPFIEETIGETRWLHNRPMPAGKAGMAVVAVGLDLYVIGGETTIGVTNVVAAYDTIEHIWTELTAKPTAVTDVTAAVLFGEIYVPGGRLADGSVTAVVEAYSPVNDGWRSVSALPRPVAGGLTLSDGDFLYFFGGWDGRQYLDTAYVYDPAVDSWRPLVPLAQPRAFAAGEVVTNQLYVVGGTDGAELTVCQAYNPTAAVWSNCPDMLVPRAGAGAATLLNKLYILGGVLDGNGEDIFGEIYDPSSQTWQVVSPPMLTESNSWTNLGVTNVETRIYALGGHRGSTFSDETLVYSPFLYQTFVPEGADK